MTRYCKNCGAELSDGSVFCDECGTKSGESGPRYNASNNLFSSYGIDMMDGEDVIRQSQIHKGCLILPLIVMGIGILWGFIFSIFVLTNLYYFAIGAIFLGFLNPFMIVGLIWFIIRFIAYKTNDLILTNKRVFGKCGLISTTQMQAPLNKIDSVSFSNGLVGKIIGYGTVKIYTTSSTFKFRFIREGESFYNDIFNQLEISETEKRIENASIIVEEFSKKLD